MEKLAPADYPIHELLARRWSPRAFDSRPIEPDKLASLFEAARWAPSSFNEQPWDFIVATKDGPEDFERLLACLSPTNATWARSAPVLMISIAKLRFARNNAENRHAFHDVGQAVANLIVQATAFGIQVHQMAGLSVDKARESLGIPESHAPVAAIAIGYPGDPAILPESMRERESAPRQRKRIEEFVHHGRWSRLA